jgi:hypothetical protein
MGVTNWTGKEETMLSRCVLVALIAIITANLPPWALAGEALPNLAGTYPCEPQPSPCRSGQPFTVTQNGDHLDKSDNGYVGHAKLTSPISVSAWPTWNSLGVITSDNHIEWSNGTKWRPM